MNKVVLALVLLCIVVAANAALSRGNYADKNHPGKCNLDGRILEPGTHQSPDKCVRIQCSSNGDIQFATCGVKRVEGCKPGSLVDETKDYPDCCRQYFDCNGEIKQF